VVVTTPGRLYVFLGGPGLQGAFSGYSSRSLGALLAWGASLNTCAHLWTQHEPDAP